MGAMTEDDAAHEQLATVLKISRDLRGAETAADLLARAVDSLCRHGGFARGVVVAIEDGQLSTRTMATVAHAPSDRLRRTILAAPLHLAAGTAEYAAFRRGAAARRGPEPADSTLGQALGIKDLVVAPIAPDALTLGLIAMEVSNGPASATAATLLDLVCMIVGLELARLVQRARVGHLVDHVRHFAAGATVLSREAFELPTSLPHDRGLGPAFLSSGDEPALARHVAGVLTERERRVVALLAEGRSNREIAEILTLSVETVKSHVVRILRKLGAANRAEAVALYMRADDRPSS